MNVYSWSKVFSALESCRNMWPYVQCGIRNARYPFRGQLRRPFVHSLVWPSASRHHGLGYKWYDWYFSICEEVNEWSHVVALQVLWQILTMFYPWYLIRISILFEPLSNKCLSSLVAMVSDRDRDADSSVCARRFLHTPWIHLENGLWFNPIFPLFHWNKLATRFPLVQPKERRQKIALWLFRSFLSVR